MFQVIELSSLDVQKTMLELANRMDNDGLRPSYILGILNGGYYPAKYFAERWGDEPELQFYKLQRSTTGKFKNFLVKIIKTILPKKLINQIFAMEMSFYAWKHQHKKRNRFADNKAVISFFKENVEVNKVSKKKPLTIVDDAIDTGSTLFQIVRAAENCCIDREAIKVVVIVHTFTEPLIRADYFMHKDIVVRFPWTVD